MARSKKSTQEPSINDILNMDIEDFLKLGVKDLRKRVRRLADAGNKRINRLNQAGYNTPAYRQVMHSGGKFSTRSKNLNQLRAEYIRAKNFFEHKTSTIKGWRETVKSTIESLRDYDIDITPEQFDDVWRAYEELKEINPNVSSERLKYAVLLEISKFIKTNSRKDAKRIASEIKEKVDQIYEQQAERDNDGGVSSFFE